MTRTRGIWALMLSFLVALTGMGATFNTPAQAVDTNDIVWLTYTPDPDVDVPMSEYRVHVWNDGAAGTDMQFTGVDPDGNFTATILSPDTNADSLNLIVHRPSAEEPDNVWAWQTGDLTNIALGYSVDVSYETPNEFSYRGDGPQEPTPPADPEAQSVDIVFTPDPNVAADDYDIWLWHASEDGTSVPFEGTDDAGNLTATIMAPDGVEAINFIVRQGGDDWTAQTPDIANIPVPSTVTLSYDDPENYVVESPDAPPTEEPGELLTEVEIILHYVRYDNNYDGWNVWTWLPGGDGRSEPLADEDGDHVARFTHSDPDGIEEVGIIIRQSIDGNDWAAKNNPEDLFIRDFPNGVAEVWIVQGNPTIFTDPSALPEEPEMGQCQDLHTEEFNAENYYAGELGAIYTPDSTTFRLWAPTAEVVEFVNYSDGGEAIEMTAGESGTWQIDLEGDQLLTEYNYRLTFEDGTMTESTDPYARAVTANGTRTVVVDAENLVPDNWDGTRMPSFDGIEDAIIYEAHVRDLTIGETNGIENKGKFLGLTETGTTTEAGNASGLDYLSSLGVTHVQFLPLYDFGSVDETGDLSYGAQYNWGYDPMKDRKSVV